MGTSIAVFVHGRGRGHASRMRVVVPALEAQGHRCTVYGGGSADDLLSHLPRYRPIQPLYPGLGELRKLPQRVRQDLRTLRDEAPDAVLSDGDLPSVLAARRLGIPVVAVGHNLVFTRCHLPKGLPTRRIAYEFANGFAATWLAKYAVAVHFLPVEPRTPGTWVARPLLEAFPESPPVREPYFVAYFRDKNGGPWLRELAATHRVVVYGGLDAPPEGVELRDFDRATFREDLSRCAGVIASAGSNLMAECVLTRTPILALHLPNDHEQALNAQWAAREGVAMAGCIDQPDGTMVRRFAERALSGDYRSVDLEAALPPVTDQVALAVRAAIASSGGPSS